MNGASLPAHLAELARLLEAGELQAAAALSETVKAGCVGAAPLSAADLERARTLFSRCVQLGARLHEQTGAALSDAGSLRRAVSAYER